MINRIRELIKYQEVIKNFVSRDLKTRYRGSFLGFFWSFLNPLLNLVILAIVFTFIARVQVKNFVIFLLIGILIWNFLSSALVQGARSIIDNGGLIKKIYLPREIFPLSVVLGNLVHLVFALLVLLLFFIYFRIFPNFFWVLLPYFFVLQFFFIFGLVLLVSTLGVYFRDVPLLIESGLPAWYFATPIFYPPSLVPSKYLAIYLLNPMASYITAYRSVIIDNLLPGREIFLVTLLAALFSFVFGYFVFTKFEKKFAEEV